MKTSKVVPIRPVSLTSTGEVYGSNRSKHSPPPQCCASNESLWRPRSPPDRKSGEGKSKSGLKMTILDIIIGAGLATVQSIWNTPMLVWVISWLQMAGLTFLPLWGTSLVATFVIGLVLCALTPVVRWSLKKLFS